MSTTTAKDVKVPAKTWTDVNGGTYAKALVQNKMGHPVYLATGPVAPTETENPRGQLLANGKFTLFDAEANVWAFCEFNTVVHVNEVS